MVRHCGPKYAETDDFAKVCERLDASAASYNLSTRIKSRKPLGAGGREEGLHVHRKKGVYQAVANGLKTPMAPSPADRSGS